MPQVLKAVRYAEVAYEVRCDSKRSPTMIHNLRKDFENDPGYHSAYDDTRVNDSLGGVTLLKVTYTDLAAANRLDARVREILRRKVD